MLSQRNEDFRLGRVRFQEEEGVAFGMRRKANANNKISFTIKIWIRRMNQNSEKDDLLPKYILELFLIEKNNAS